MWAGRMSVVAVCVAEVCVVVVCVAEVCVVAVCVAEVCVVVVCVVVDLMKPLIHTYSGAKKYLVNH